MSDSFSQLPATRIVLYDTCLQAVNVSGGFNEISFTDPDEGVNGMIAFTFVQVCGALPLVRCSPPLQIFANPDISRVRREEAWERLKPDIWGPSQAYFEWGPQKTPGLVAFGGRPKEKMTNFLVKKREGARAGRTSRYFSAQGAEYRWRIEADRMDCCDTNGKMLAVWTRLIGHSHYYGKLEVLEPGFLLITELVATLVLNRIALEKEW